MSCDQCQDSWIKLHNGYPELCGFCRPKQQLEKMKAALRKLRDGPGNNMTGWKLTWASTFAEKALEE